MSQACEARAPTPRGGLEASQHVPGNKKHQEPREVRTEWEDRQRDLKGIAEDILIVKKGLEEEGVESS